MLLACLFRKASCSKLQNLNTKLTNIIKSNETQFSQQVSELPTNFMSSLTFSEILGNIHQQEVSNVLDSSQKRTNEFFKNKNKHSFSEINFSLNCYFKRHQTNRQIPRKSPPFPNRIFKFISRSSPNRPFLHHSK